MGGGNMNDLFELFNFFYFSNVPYLHRNETKPKTKGKKPLSLTTPGMGLCGEQTGQGLPQPFGPQFFTSRTSQ